MCGRSNRQGGELVYFIWLNLRGSLWSGIFSSDFWPQATYGLVYFSPEGDEAMRSWSAKSFRYIANKNKQAALNL